MNPSIQFIMEYSKDQIPFLDVLIKRNKNGIWMDLYHKPTDIQRCLPFTSSHPNHCKRNIPFCLPWRICTIAENNAEKLKNFENVKSNLSKYHYPDSLIKQGLQEALSIPQKDLEKPKRSSNGNILPFITTFNPNNPNIYSTSLFSVNCLKNNNVSTFHNIKRMQSKRQSPNLKKLLPKAEKLKVLLGTFNCSHRRCECFNYPLINDHYTFKNIQITFKLKNRFICDTFNLICVVICDTCKEEFIGKTDEGKIKLRDRVSASLTYSTTIIPKI